MDIEELSKELYEDLNGRITAVDFTDNLIIYFQCDDWKDYEKIKKFKITCNSVSESEIQPSPSGEVSFSSSHQLLWNHNEPHGYLYYTSEPENRYDILGRIWEVHEKTFGGWRPLTDYANTYNAGQFIEFCHGSNGLLAQGPKLLIELYQQAIVGRIQTNYVPSYNPDGDAKALVFDNCFVICKSVAVEVLSS